MEHRLFAASYDRLLAHAEQTGLRAQRRELLSAVRGTVLEIGAGTGLNLDHYAGLDRLLLTEPDAAMRRRLQRRVAQRQFAFPVLVNAAQAGAGTGLGAADSVDVVVSTLVLCSVADQNAALAEIADVLRPGGRLVLIEHVRGHGAGGVLQELLTPLQRVIAGGCHLNRPTAATLRRHGFDTSNMRPWTMPGSLRILGPAIAGVAIAPGGIPV